MILTQEFLSQAGVCADGQTVAESGSYIGVEYDEVIRDLVSKGKLTDAGWMLEQKKTELYVRSNGSVFTMGAYQVFNPLTGVHTKYETETEVKAALVDIAKEVLKQHCPTVVQELSNENGDTTWIPTTMNETLMVS